MFFGFSVSASDISESVNYYLGVYKGTKLLYNDERVRLNLNNINIYKVNNYDNQIYLVNVMDLPELDEKCICEIKIVSKDFNCKTKGDIEILNKDIMEVIIYEDENIDIIYTPLKESTFRKFTTKAIDIDLEQEDEVQEILKETMAFEYHYKSIIYSTPEQMNDLSSSNEDVNEYSVNAVSTFSAVIYPISVGILFYNF